MDEDDQTGFPFDLSDSEWTVVDEDVSEEEDTPDKDKTSHTDSNKTSSLPRNSQTNVKVTAVSKVSKSPVHVSSNKSNLSSVNSSKASSSDTKQNGATSNVGDNKSADRKGSHLTEAKPSTVKESSAASTAPASQSDTAQQIKSKATAKDSDLSEKLNSLESSKQTVAIDSININSPLNVSLNTGNEKKSTTTGAKVVEKAAMDVAISKPSNLSQSLPVKTTVESLKGSPKQALSSTAVLKVTLASTNSSSKQGGIQIKSQASSSSKQTPAQSQPTSKTEAGSLAEVMETVLTDDTSSSQYLGDMEDISDTELPSPADVNRSPSGIAFVNKVAATSHKRAELIIKSSSSSERVNNEKHQSPSGKIDVKETTGSGLKGPISTQSTAPSRWVTASSTAPPAVGPVKTGTLIVSNTSRVASATSEARTSSTPVKTPVGPAPVKTPVGAAPVKTPVSAAPVKTPVGATPVKTPVGATPVKTPVGAAPLKTPVGAAPVKTPVCPTPVKTPVGAAPVKTPVGAAPVKTPVVATPVKTPICATPVKTPVGAAPVKTDVAATPVSTPGGAAPTNVPGSVTSAGTSTTNLSVASTTGPVKRIIRRFHRTTQTTSAECSHKLVQCLVSIASLDAAPLPTKHAGVQTQADRDRVFYQLPLPDTVRPEIFTMVAAFDVNSPGSRSVIQGSYKYGISLGQVTATDIEKKLMFRENLLSKSSYYSLCFDQQNVGVLDMLFADQDQFYTVMTNIRKMKIGPRHLVVTFSRSLSESERCPDHPVPSVKATVIFNQNFYSMNFVAINKAPLWNRPKVEETLTAYNVPAGVPLDFLKLIIPDAVTIEIDNNKKQTFTKEDSRVQLGMSERNGEEFLLNLFSQIYINNECVIIAASNKPVKDLPGFSDIVSEKNNRSYDFQLKMPVKEKIATPRYIGGPAKGAGVSLEPTDVIMQADTVTDPNFLLDKPAQAWTGPSTIQKLKQIAAKEKALQEEKNRSLLKNLAVSDVSDLSDVSDDSSALKKIKQKASGFAAKKAANLRRRTTIASRKSEEKASTSDRKRKVPVTDRTASHATRRSTLARKVVTESSSSRYKNDRHHQGPLSFRTKLIQKYSKRVQSSDKNKNDNRKTSDNEQLKRKSSDTKLTEEPAKKRLLRDGRQGTRTQEGSDRKWEGKPTHRSLAHKDKTKKYGLIVERHFQMTRARRLWAGKIVPASDSVRRVVKRQGSVETKSREARHQKGSSDDQRKGDLLTHKRHSSVNKVERESSGARSGVVDAGKRRESSGVRKRMDMGKRQELSGGVDTVKRRVPSGVRSGEANTGNRRESSGVKSGEVDAGNSRGVRKVFERIARGGSLERHGREFVAEARKSHRLAPSEALQRAGSLERRVSDLIGLDMRDSERSVPRFSPIRPMSQERYKQDYPKQEEVTSDVLDRRDMRLLLEGRRRPNQTPREEEDYEDQREVKLDPHLRRHPRPARLDRPDPSSVARESWQTQSGSLERESISRREGRPIRSGSPKLRDAVSVRSGSPQSGVKSESVSSFRQKQISLGIDRKRRRSQSPWQKENTSDLSPISQDNEDSRQILEGMWLAPSTGSSWQENNQKNSRMDSGNYHKETKDWSADENRGSREPFSTVERRRIRENTEVEHESRGSREPLSTVERRRIREQAEGEHESRGLREPFSAVERRRIQEHTEGPDDSRVSRETFSSVERRKIRENTEGLHENRGARELFSTTERSRIRENTERLIPERRPSPLLFNPSQRDPSEFLANSRKLYGSGVNFTDTGRGVGLGDIVTSSPAQMFNESRENWPGDLGRRELPPEDSRLHSNNQSMHTSARFEARPDFEMNLQKPDDLGSYDGPPNMRYQFGNRHMGGSAANQGQSGGYQSNPNVPIAPPVVPPLYADERLAQLETWANNLAEDIQQQVNPWSRAATGPPPHSFTGSSFSGPTQPMPYSGPSFENQNTHFPGQFSNQNTHFPGQFSNQNTHFPGQSPNQTTHFPGQSHNIMQPPPDMRGPPPGPWAQNNFY